MLCLCPGSLRMYLHTSTDLEPGPINQTRKSSDMTVQHIWYLVENKKSSYFVSHSNICQCNVAPKHLFKILCLVTLSLFEKCLLAPSFNKIFCAGKANT